MREPVAEPATVILVTHDGLGQAERPLRHKLMRAYLTLLLENQLLPAALCFYTEGVRLVLKDSTVLDLLQALEARGVLLLSCATCLSYYGVADQVAIGIVGGMHDILIAQWRAAKVITV